MGDEIRRQNEAQMNEKQRQQKITQQKISSDAVARGADFQQLPDPLGEYQAAVIRILSGMPIKLLTLYGLNGGFGKTATPTAKTPNVAGVGLGANDPYFDPYNPVATSKIPGGTAGTGGY